MSDQKDDRYELIPVMLKVNKINVLRDMVKYVPKSVLAEDMGMNNTRFSRLLENVEDFTIEELFRLAVLCEISHERVLDLVLMQYRRDADLRQTTP